MSIRHYSLANTLRHRGPGATMKLSKTIHSLAEKWLPRLFRDSTNRLDYRLRDAIAKHSPEDYVVNTKVLPVYRFVDLYRAIDALGNSNSESGGIAIDRIDTKAKEDLTDLLRADLTDWCTRKIVRSSESAWTVADDMEEFLPNNCFWIFTCPHSVSAHPVIVRLNHNAYDEQANLEVAAAGSDAAKMLLALVLEHSLTHSIYRHKLLSVSFQTGNKDEFGDIEKQERLRIGFRLASPVARDQFVIDDEVFSTLYRNVVDLHRRSALLKQHGVPLRRGVLLYGPPGTGKTYACRYLFGELPETTRIVATGSALHKISRVFDLARLYQPSLIVLEDVDLVFASREINLYSSSLGDLLDQMDGLRPHEDVSVILTTNSIERLESAIKDRPGRISQCIYLGPPGAALRQRYLAHYIESYDSTAIDWSKLVTRSEGATPAFIKEWVHRAVQFATERIDRDHPTLQLNTQDFELAHEEMTRYTDESGKRIIGFIDR